MKKAILITIFLAPIFMVAQVSFDFKGKHQSFGWIESGGSSENSGITTEGYELNWNAFKTPKLKHDTANIDALRTPILAVTVKIKSRNIKTLRITHANANIKEEKVHLAEEILYQSPVAQTYYFDLSGENWRNYTEEGDHDFIEIGFQGADKMNLIESSSYGDLVIEKIEFLENLQEEDAIQEITVSSDNADKWDKDHTSVSITDAE